MNGANSHVFSHGMRDTRVALEAWNGRPWAALRGWLGLSGLSPAQVSVVAAAYRSTRVVATPTRDDWAAVVVTPGG